MRLPPGIRVRCDGGKDLLELFISDTRKRGACSRQSDGCQDEGFLLMDGRRHRTLARAASNSARVIPKRMVPSSDPPPRKVMPLRSITRMEGRRWGKVSATTRVTSGWSNTQAMRAEVASDP